MFFRDMDRRTALQKRDGDSIDEWWAVCRYGPLEREGGIVCCWTRCFFRDVDLELANSMIDKEQIQFPRAQ